MKLNYKNLNQNILFIKSTETIKSLLNKFSNGKKQIAICLNKTNQVLSVVSLGDIRRIIAKKIETDQPIIKFSNKSFFYIYDYIPKHEYCSRLIKFKKNNNKKTINDVIILNKRKQFIKIINENEILNNLEYKNTSIIGLGFVGLPLLAYISSKNIHCVGLDRPDVIKKIKSNNIKFYEKNLNSALKQSYKYKKFSLETNLKKIYAENYIICIGTYLKKQKIDNRILFQLLVNLIKYNFKENDLLIIRGTVNLGLTKKIANFINIKSKKKLVVGKNFYVSFLPERIVQGDALNELTNLPQIVAGVTKVCVAKSIDFCSKIFPNNIVAESTEEAEIIKLASNSYRDLTFSFSNELSRICGLYNIDTRILIDRANQGYHRNNIPYPSPGVGGSCLVKDPILFSYLSSSRKDGYKLGKQSREINQEAIKEIFKNIKKIINRFVKNKFKMLIVGLAFKGEPETSDLRESSSLKLIDLLKKNKINFDSYDSVLDKINKKNLHYKNLNLKKKIINLYDYDLVLIMNNNNNNFQYINSKFKSSKKNKKFLYDCWNMFAPEKAKAAGFDYISLGKWY